MKNEQSIKFKFILETQSYRVSLPQHSLAFKIQDTPGLTFFELATSEVIVQSHVFSISCWF